VTLLGPQAAAKTPDNDPPGFLSGLGAGWKALVTSLTVLLTVLGALLPWLLAIGLPAWAILWAIRRYRRPHPVGGQADEPAPALATSGGTAETE
jgi:cytochrome c oxidase assembly factor CtaG